MRQFLARHHRKLFILSICQFVIAVALWAGGCGPLTWLSDALQILPIAGSMLSSVLTLIGALTGSTVETHIAEVVSEYITKAMAGITDLQAIVAEYKQSPSATLLLSIESGTKAVIDNISKLLSDTGITDTATQSKVVSILKLFLSEVEAFATLLPALKASHGETLTVIVPMTSKEAKAAFNSIISTPTGNPSVDGALAKLHKL